MQTFVCLTKFITCLKHFFLVIDYHWTRILGMNWMRCATLVLRSHCKLVVICQSRTLTNWCSIGRPIHDRLIVDTNSRYDHLSVRCLSKTRDKLKDKKKGLKPKVMLSDEEMSELIPVSELKIELNSVIDRLKADLMSNVNIRSNPKSIEHLIVQMNGQKHSLNELVNISRKSPQLVVLNMSSIPDAIKPVLTAIEESGMNLSPQQEGTVIYVPIPKVTREHREGLADNARTLNQKAKDELKGILSSFTNYTKKQKKAHVSEELIFNVNENLKHLIDTKLHECDHLLEQKLKELLK